MHTLPENWKPVVGYESHYEVSDLGRVRSLPRTVKHTAGYLHSYPGKMLKRNFTEDGYIAVALSAQGKARKHAVHSLVAAAFIGPRPAKHHVDHVNRRRDDNRAANLRYLEAGENLAQGDIRGAKNGNAKLTPEQVLQIVQMRGTRMGKDIAAIFGVVPTAVGDILTGRNWSHLTGIPRPYRAPRRRT